MIATHFSCACTRQAAVSCMHALHGEKAAPSAAYAPVRLLPAACMSLACGEGSPFCCACTRQAAVSCMHEPCMRRRPPSASAGACGRGA
jgi:hypothetical protein